MHETVLRVPCNELIEIRETVWVCYISTIYQHHGFDCITVLTVAILLVPLSIFLHEVNQIRRQHLFNFFFICSSYVFCGCCVMNHWESFHSRFIEFPSPLESRTSTTAVSVILNICWSLRYMTCNLFALFPCCRCPFGFAIWASETFSVEGPAESGFSLDN